MAENSPTVPKEITQKEHFTLETKAGGLFSGPLAAQLLGVPSQLRQGLQEIPRGGGSGVPPANTPLAFSFEDGGKVAVPLVGILLHF